jgi:hypothetical protein
VILLIKKIIVGSLLIFTPILPYDRNNTNIQLYVAFRDKVSVGQRTYVRLNNRMFLSTGFETRLSNFNSDITFNPASIDYNIGIGYRVSREVGIGIMHDCFHHIYDDYLRDVNRFGDENAKYARSQDKLDFPQTSRNRVFIDFFKF